MWSLSERDRIRTCDRLLRRQMLYPAELRTHFWVFQFIIGIHEFFKKKKTLERVFFKVGAAGFEPATSWSQTRRDDRTTLRPEKFLLRIAESKGFEPLVQFPVRLFSKQVLSATQATLHCNVYKSFCSVIASANIK